MYMINYKTFLSSSTRRTWTYSVSFLSISVPSTLLHQLKQWGNNFLHKYWNPTESCQKTSESLSYSRQLLAWRRSLQLRSTSSADRLRTNTTCCMLDALLPINWTRRLQRRDYSSCSLKIKHVFAQGCEELGKGTQPTCSQSFLKKYSPRLFGSVMR